MNRTLSYAIRLVNLSVLQRTQPAAAAFISSNPPANHSSTTGSFHIPPSSPPSSQQQFASMSESASKFRIYTKTGDKGTASLYNGQRRAKDDDVFHALGDVDELNSAIGVAQEFCSTHRVDQEVLRDQLEIIMSRLLDVGSAVATPVDSSSQQKLARVQFSHEATAQLEAWLDAMDDQLPPLKNFILPSGGKAAAHLHMARSVCRRAERSVVPLVRGETVDPEVGVYLNRLSDFLFTAARFAAQQDGKAEIIYRKAH